ncbi:MAG: phospho-N-acetylmuramoyl-pentapeptide-transferase, partial [Ruminiclostridium sp.]|nr:phospho-N-acetylmuramoyl-pentapeptide-transferase [Ruminiclostridium sp.]
MLPTILITAMISLVITGVLGFWVIPALRKLKFGQTILDIGPVWHKKDKQGTPTMGGIMFIVGV